MTYPRTRNGWIDGGSPIRGGGNKCPNCGSKNFRETLSMEKCNDCGLLCDYWGGGANEVYDRYHRNLHADEKREAEERHQKEEQEEQEWRDRQNDDD